MSHMMEEKELGLCMWGVHLTNEPDRILFQTISLLKIVHVITLIAMLNEVKICAYDIRNVYLETLAKEKLHIVVVPEFKKLAGHIPN